MASVRRRSTARTRSGQKERRVELSPLLLTVEQAGQVLGISRDSVYRLLASGRLRSIKIGCLRRVPIADLERFVADAAA